MINILILIITIIVILEHLYFLWLEMFAWETLGKKTFKMLPKDIFKPTKGMAANQGLYNGFLAMGLIWSFFITDPVWSNNIKIFFFVCVAIAGIYAGITVSKRIFVIQAIPAMAGLALILFLK